MYIYVVIPPPPPPPPPPPLSHTISWCVHVGNSKHLVSAPTARVQVDHFLSWQQCGDLHCLSSKMSSSLNSDLEDFRLENPEDTPIIAVATRLHPPESGSKEEACLTMHTNRETSLWRR